MLKEGQQVSVYRVKEVISETTSHFCCLTEDPFFHSTVLLKVYPIDFLKDDQEREELVHKLDDLVTKLEHPSIAPVFDSGCEGQYFYYTTNYNYQSPLHGHTMEGLPHGEILKIVHDLSSALEHAFNHSLVHGNLGIDDIYIGDDGQAVIADFGIEYAFRCSTEEQELGWSEALALKNLGRLQLQLLRPSSTDNSGREFELLSGIVDEQIRTVTERFFIEEPDCYQSFAEMMGALGGLIEKPPAENRPVVQHKSLTSSAATGITDQQREQVLPHVRKLISEKNHYKNLLEEALLKQNKTEDQLKQTLLEIEQFTQRQLMAPDNFVSPHRKKVVRLVLVGFVTGIILSAGYGYLLRQDNLISRVQGLAVETQVVMAQSESAEFRNKPIHAEQHVVEKNLPGIDESSIKNIVPNLEVDPPLATSKRLERTTPVLEVQSQQWWPAGREFDVAVTVDKSSNVMMAVENTEGISQGDREDILQEVSAWIDSWVARDSTAYFSHYSDKYRPESGTSLKSWMKTRKDRLKRPDWIKLEIQEIMLRKVAVNRVQVKFQQNYHSNFYQDKIWKSLNLVNEKGVWKIITERSLGKVGLVAGR